MPRQRSKPSSSPSPLNRTNSDDPSDLDKTIFIGNLPTISTDRKEMEEMFSKYGKISGLRLFHSYGFVQYEREEDAKAAVQGEKGRKYKGHRLGINKAAEGRNMNKAPSRSSPSRRDLYTYGESRDTKRERSPLRGSPRRDGRDGRDSRATRESRDGREPRDTRDVRESRDIRDARDSREPRDMRDTRDARDSRDYRESRELREARELRDARAVRDSRDIRDPLYDRYRDALYRRDEPLDKYRQEELYRKKEDAFDRFRDPLDRFPREEEHRNMPLADAMVLVARNHEQFKSEARDKEREDIARQATKMSTDALLRERAPPMDEGLRGTHPPTIQPLLALLADNRYVTPEEMDKVILYLRDRKDRLLSADPLSSQLSRPQMGSSQVTSMDSQSGLTNNKVMQMSQQMSQQMNQPMSSAPQAQQSLSNPQQELQAKILSLFNSGSQANINPAGPVGASVAAPNQGYGNVGNSQLRPGQMNTSPLGQVQRNQPAMNQHPNVMGVGVPIRNTIPRPGGPLPSQAVYGQLQNRAQVPVNVQGQRPAGSAGINFDNPSVQKALDTLIQSGPALSHLVNQTAGQGGRGGLPPQPSMGSYQRHY
ncbi:nuclear receptor coactivator 5 isoform X3 [Pelobates fuscus]|uniref:nuclear receptor coactivator 5 isoform X3 n=1 Tax=Pelobates fuscus TaxID=191477 RepID=UPI002FE43280